MKIVKVVLEIIEGHPMVDRAELVVQHRPTPEL